MLLSESSTPIGDGLKSEIIDRHVAAQILGVTIRTLQRWHRAGQGPRRKTGRGRWVFYKRSEVEEWIGANSGAQVPREAVSRSLPTSAN